MPYPRTLIALACSCGAASALAQTGPVLSGVLDIFTGTRQLAGAERTTKMDSGGLTTSQLTISGGEDLGAGLQAEYALGMFLRANTGETGRFTGDAYFGRTSYVGLAGPLGTLRLGRLTSTNFLNFIRTNAFADSAVFGPAFVQTWISAIAQGSAFVTPGAPPTSRTLTGVLGTTDSAWNNTVGYTLPAFGATTVSLQWSPQSAGVGSRQGASVFHADGPLNLALAVEVMGYGAVPASGPAAAVLQSQRTWQLSGAYAMPWGRVSAGYLDTRRDFASIVDDTVRTWHVGATVRAGTGSVLFQTAHSRQVPEAGTATTRNTTSLGYDYPLSKRTDVYAVAMTDRFTGQSSGTSFGVGVRHRF